MSEYSMLGIVVAVVIPGLEIKVLVSFPVFDCTTSWHLLPLVVV